MRKSCLGDGRASGARRAPGLCAKMFLDSAVSDQAYVPNVVIDAPWATLRDAAHEMALRRALLSLRPSASSVTARTFGTAPTGPVTVADRSCVSRPASALLTSSRPDLKFRGFPPRAD